MSESYPGENQPGSLDKPASRRRRRKDALGRDPFEELGTPDRSATHFENTGFEPEPTTEPRFAQPTPERHDPEIDPSGANVDPAPHEPEIPRAQTAGESAPRAATEGATGWLDALLGERDGDLQEAFERLVEADTGYDRYGFSPAVARQSFPIFQALYRYYFRVKSEGHEHLPDEGAAILCANHGGLLPFDAAMGIVDVALHMDPPRLVRSIVDRWVGTLPWVNIFYARVGQVIGTRKNFADLLQDDQLVLVFPEGLDGIRKTIRQRYRLQEFRMGFMAQALRNATPIIPVAFVGNDDQMPILYDIKPLARRLGIPVAPITPTFPLLGPLGLIPYPVSYKIVYGEPLRFHERFGPEAADDKKLVATLARQVQEHLQELLDGSRT